ncbi:MAG: rod shape-determining protein MreC [Candidatus Eisenbacteria bacterium]|nr:rod shape-determining protein MreC [Candidatus Eisenbacteria bacterium]
MAFHLTRLLRGNRDLSTFLTCAAVSFVLLALPPAAKETAGRALSGVVLGPFKRLTTAAIETAQVREENAALRRIAAELMNERNALIEHRQENERLRELLRVLVTFPEEESFELLPARVIGMPGGRVIERMEIDRGAEHGARAGMAVVTPEGLVGKVVTVHPTRALVEPLANASSAVSVVTERGRVRGVLKPRYHAASELTTWQIDYVPARSDVEPGDRVITSGLGGVVPAGLSVGTVTSVEDGPLTMEVDVRLNVDFSKVEHVFVITGTRSGPRPLTDMEEKLLREIEKLSEEEHE